MKKIKLLVFVLLTTTIATAQNKLTFGPMIGFNAYDIELEGPLSTGGATSGLNFGGFGDYQISRGFGVRAMLTYNTIKEQGYTYNDGVTYEELFEEAKLNTLQLHGLLRYDTAGDYNKGFYLTGGFRIVNVLSAKVDGADAEGFYKKTNFGALLGFGVTISRTVGLELLGDANLTDTVEAGKSNNYGVYANLTVDISAFLK